MIVHAWYLEDMVALRDMLRSSGLLWHLVITTIPDRGKTLEALLPTIDLTCEVETVENKGPDVLPFLKVVSRLMPGL